MSQVPFQFVPPPTEPSWLCHSPAIAQAQHPCWPGPPALETRVTLHGQASTLGVMRMVPAVKALGTGMVIQRSRKRGAESPGQGPTFGRNQDWGEPHPSPQLGGPQGQKNVQAFPRLLS